MYFGLPNKCGERMDSCECYMCACAYSCSRVSHSQARSKKLIDHSIGMMVTHVCAYALEFIHKRLCRSTADFFDHVNDCSVQCAQTGQLRDKGQQLS